MNERVPADSGDARGASPDDPRIVRLGRCPFRDYALTRPCCLWRRSGYIGGDTGVRRAEQDDTERKKKGGR
jgi:hypothetical protein